MRVIELKAENFKRLRAVEIKPDGDIVTITGANNAGKSSVVDAIYAALQARTALKEIPQPVRTGEKGAMITLNLGEYTVMREIEPSGRTRLKVTSNETGAPVRSPQGVVDGLLSSLCIDPSAFTKSPPRDQVDTLIGLVDTEGFLAKNEELRQQWYDHRTAKGRVRDQAKAVFDATERPDLPDVKPDMEALKAKIEAVREEYAQSLAVLAKFDQTEKWAESQVNYEAAKIQYDEATGNLDTIADNRNKWLARAQLPVPGLAFDFEKPCVLYNGVPLQQASTSEQLRIGAAIAMACRPELRVIRVRDGNCLDAQSLGMLSAMAKENDFQLWIEKVDETGEIGFFIEDGQVKAIDGAPLT